MNIHPCHTIRRAEQELFESGFMGSDELMDAAIEESFALLSRDPQFNDITSRYAACVVYAGKGKNAGDAIGLAWKLGFSQVTLRCAAPVREMAPETRRQLAYIPTDCLYIETECPEIPPGGALLIDGLLGSGARGALSPEYADLVREMNSLRARHPRTLTLAVDIPTGLQADSGEVAGEAVAADATLALGCVKPGMVADGAEDYVGRLLCVELPGIELPESAESALDENTLAWLPRRAYSCFKNRAGRVRVIAGSPGYIGAAEMCAEAALSVGAGLVELCCLPEIYPILAARVSPEILVHPVAHYGELPPTEADALLIGPGLGAHPTAENLQALRALVEQPPCPLVLDADGLNLTAAHGWGISPRAILTPHPGEMRRLFPAGAGLERAACAAAFVQAHPCTLLLKGARSLITDGDRLWYNTTGGPWMANGGQGDVLAGVIAGLVAQGVPAPESAALGAYLCGRAATLALEEHGFPIAIHASQLLPHLTVA